MALMNQQLNPDLETLFMMPSARYTFLSSSLVKEVFALGGSIRELVPAIVEEKLREKYAEESKSLSS
jgi:pantetheine-phosphate adenylyltransferase